MKGSKGDMAKAQKRFRRDNLLLDKTQIMYGPSKHTFESKHQYIIDYDYH